MGPIITDPAADTAARGLAAPMGLIAPTQEKYTQSQIAEALMSVAASILHARLDRSAALSLAGVLGVFINDARNTNFIPGGNLEGNPAFNSLVAEKAPLLAQAVNDPAAAKAAAQAEVDRYNVSGGPLSAAAMAAKGFMGLAQAGSAADGGGSGGSDRATSSTAYGQALSSNEGAVYTSLSNMGYKPEAIDSALSYARNIGATPDMARKFIKLDQESRGDLQGFIENVRNDTALTAEQKQAKIAEYTKQHPKLRGAGITDGDILRTINNKNGAKAKKDIDAYNRTSDEQKLAAHAGMPSTRKDEAEMRIGVGATVNALLGGEPPPSPLRADSGSTLQRHAAAAPPQASHEESADAAGTAVRPKQVVSATNTKKAAAPSLNA